jgi:hypothetical protein
VFQPQMAIMSSRTLTLINITHPEIAERKTGDFAFETRRK